MAEPKAMSIRQKIQELESYIEVLNAAERVMNLNSGDITSLRPSGKGAPQAAQGPLTSMSLPDAIKEVLEDAGRAPSKETIS